MVKVENRLRVIFPDILQWHPCFSFIPSLQKAKKDKRLQTFDNFQAYLLTQKKNTTVHFIDIKEEQHR